jgi:putative peptidoglycan lipid II flippase
VLLAMLFARAIMRLLVAGNDTTSRHAQIRLGAFFLLFVLPQVVLYAWGAIVTAALHAEGRFAAAAAAPVANNVVVTAAVGLFWARGASGLGIGGVDQFLLGAGALGGVLCMTLVPALAARRAGMRIAPRWRSGDGYSASLRDAAWASLVVIPAQLFLVGSIVVASRVAGGVVAIQVAFTLFLLPHALLAHPFTTVLYPRIAGAWVDNDHDAVRRESGRGLLVTLVLTAPAGALLGALAPWVTRLIAVGALGRGAGPAVVSAALFGYAIGLPFYSWSLLLARISYAAGDVRAPGVWAMVGGAVGGFVLVVGARHADAATLRWIGIAHATMVLVAAAAVLAVLARRAIAPPDARWATVVVSAVVAGFAARFVADATNDAATRLHALTALAGGGAAGVVVYGAALRAGGLRLRTFRELTT